MGLKAPSHGGLAPFAVLVLAIYSFGADDVPRHVAGPFDDDAQLANCACNADVVPPFGGQPDFQDLLAVANCVQSGICICNPTCDVNCDGTIDNADNQAAQCRFQGGPPSVCCPNPPPPPPPDQWTTWTDGQPGRSFLELTLPAGFLGPDVGSFSGRVEFGSKPLNPGGSGDADTRLQRPKDPVRPVDPPGAQGTVPVELVALSLQSVAPITVDCGGEQHQWNVEVGLSPTVTPPPGTLTATKSHPNGGTFDCSFPVQPLLTFTQSTPATVNCSGDPPTKGNDDKCVGGVRNGLGCALSLDCPGGACLLKNRFITVVIPPTATDYGIRVSLVNLDSNSVATPGDYNGTDRWAGVPSLSVPDGISPPFNAAGLRCTFISQNWSAVGQLHMYGDVIVPGSLYDVSSCNPQATCSATALRIGTARFGDIIVPTPAVNFQDVQSIVAKFQGTPAGPSKTRTDLVGAVLNPPNPINFQDVSACVSAFQSKAFKTVVTIPPVVCGAATPQPSAAHRLGPPDCGPPVVTLDTGAPPVQPPFHLQTLGTPFVHAINPALLVVVDPAAQFVGGVVETVPGDPQSQQLITGIAHDLPDLQHTVCLPVRKKACPAGFDFLKTAPCGTDSTKADFQETPIPADFFAPGSLPFVGLVDLVGVPIDPPTSSDADTIVARRGVLNFPSVPSRSDVPIEIVALNLASAVPIQVLYGNGNPPEQWNVGLTLSDSPTAPPMGTLSALKTHRNGGTFESSFFVQPKFTFERIGGPPLVRVFDTGLLGLPPVEFRSSDPCNPGQACRGPMPWVQELAPGSPVFAGSGCFIPLVKEDPMTEEQCCVRRCHDGTINSIHCVSPTEECGAQFCADE